MNEIGAFDGSESRLMHDTSFIEGEWPPDVGLVSSATLDRADKPDWALVKPLILAGALDEVGEPPDMVYVSSEARRETALNEEIPNSVIASRDQREPFIVACYMYGSVESAQSESIGEPPGTGRAYADARREATIYDGLPSIRQSSFDMIAMLTIRAREGDISAGV